MTPPKLHFSNEINTLGEFSGGVMIGGVFTICKATRSPLSPNSVREAVRHCEDTASPSRNKKKRVKRHTPNKTARWIALSPMLRPSARVEVVLIWCMKSFAQPACAKCPFHQSASHGPPYGNRETKTGTGMPESSTDRP